MAGARKFALARDAVAQALRMLRAEDRFALVVYDDQIDVLAAGTSATPRAKTDALAMLDTVEPRGSTDLCGGWMTGCEQLADTLDEQRISRALLLTDGLANAGTTDHATLAGHAAELRPRGIATSTFGVGEDFDERLLRDLAHEGGGNFYFLEHAAQIPDLLTSELGEALQVVMRRATLRMHLSAGVDAEPLNRFRHHRTADGRELRVDLGDLVSGQELETVVRLRFPFGEVGSRCGVRVVLDSGNALAGRAESTLEWTYADHAANDAQSRDRAVDRAVARLYAARARAEATEANRHGDLAGARSVLQATRARILRYAGTDAELGALAEALQDELPDYGDAVMSPMSLKQAVFASEVQAKGRSYDGRARRRGR